MENVALSGFEPTKHWQGRYTLPRNVRRALKRPLGPLLMSGRRKTIMAVDALLTLIGRYHTSPRAFHQRGCGIGEDGGFLLDRRGLSGHHNKLPRGCVNPLEIWNDPRRPPHGCDGLTEWSVREATQFLLGANIIERITPYGANSLTDSLGRSGVWLKATKDKKTGRIKAPPIRYRLTRLYRSLFSKTLGLASPPKVPSVKSPVGESVNLSQNESLVGDVGVSTGGDHFPASRTLQEWAALAPKLREEIEAREAERRKKAMLADLEARKARRLALGGMDLPF